MKQYSDPEFSVSDMITVTRGQTWETSSALSMGPIHHEERRYVGSILTVLCVDGRRIVCRELLNPSGHVITEGPPVAFDTRRVNVEKVSPEFCETMGLAWAIEEPQEANSDG